MAKGGKAVKPRKDTFKCTTCHREFPVQKSGGTGYGVTKSGKKICYECIGKSEKREIAAARPGAKHTFYISEKDRLVSNWPGSVKYRVSWATYGQHNIAGKRVDVWFRDHTGAWWHGVQMGDFNQILHATKLKGEPTRPWHAR